MNDKNDIPLTLFEKGGNSVWHHPLMAYLEEAEILQRYLTEKFPRVQDLFLECYPQWINESKLNSVTGLEKFKHKAISIGCTQALDWFHLYAAQHGRTIKLFKGEYPYNRDIGIFEYSSQMIEHEANIHKNDAVILSYPFSGTGTKHDDYDEIMERCNELDVPVLLDCAWLGSAKNQHIDVTHKCIYGVAFSLTKSLSCGNWRSGICFSRTNEGSLAVQTEWYKKCNL